MRCAIAAKEKHAHTHTHVYARAHNAHSHMVGFRIGNILKTHTVLPQHTYNEFAMENPKAEEEEKKQKQKTQTKRCMIICVWVCRCVGVVTVC